MSRESSKTSRACNEWRPEWIASLYDELDDAEEAQLQAHLGRCAACRAELESLSVSRAALRDASPTVPSAPPVVVLAPRNRAWSPLGSFAAGLACAASLFGLGFLTATMRTDRPTEATVERATGPSPELRTQLTALQQRVAQLEQAPAEPAMTAAELRRELERLENRFNSDRAGDLEYLMRSMTATDLRTADWMNRTEQALTYIAARQDPRVSER